jgi:hypothetical protein
MRLGADTLADAVHRQHLLPIDGAEGSADVDGKDHSA